MQLLNFEICASIKATEQPVQEIFPRYDGNNPETFNLEKPSVIYKYKGLDLRSGFQLRVGDKISKMAPFSSMKGFCFWVHAYPWGNQPHPTVLMPQECCDSRKLPLRSLKKKNERCRC